MMYPANLIPPYASDTQNQALIRFTTLENESIIDRTGAAGVRVLCLLLG